GRTPTVERGRFGARTVPIGWGQEMRDQAALVRESCKWEYEVRFPEQVPELLDRAYAIATSTPQGPVYLSLPREVLCEPCPADELAAPIAMRAASVVAASDQIAEAARLLAGAERPLIVAQRGAGSTAGFEAVATIAEQWSIPVCQYWANATAISTEHAMYVGQDPSPWVAEADVILVIDSLAPWMPDLHEPAPGCAVVHLGPNPLYSRVPVRHFRSDLSITSEVGEGLVALELAMRELHPGADTAQHTRRRAVVDDRNTTRREHSRAAVEAGPGSPMTKAWVSHCLGEAIRGAVATVISELGCPFEQLALTDHGSWRQEPHSGGLGWGLPCAMGIKLADPDRLVVATMGDGSYMFANPVACHHVAEAHDIAVLTVVLNNAGYGAVRHSVLDLYPTGYAAKADEMPLTALAPTPDFAHVARACRAHAETVTDGTELPAALARAINVVAVEHRQALLDVHVA
ncbi:MAG TPA: thiamine pyrophosphate-requiring protein, partial [Ilumatobacteraceae bacterium]|nr:thiamine pyrophosphate-requiring protein [Ilumatobacteraceae bacterium]